MNKNLLNIFLLILSVSLLVGCSTSREGNVGNMQTFNSPTLEADWIRNGEPIEFEGEEWFPQDGIESLQDNEVYIIGEHRAVQFFVDRLDVRPYDRLYTKFEKNKFRYYKKRDSN